MSRFARNIWGFMEGGGKVIMKPYLCPVCEGTEKVIGGFYNGNPNPVLAREDCRACKGEGILWGWDSSPAPAYPPWISPGDGNTTSPPFTITWGSPTPLSNIPPNFNGGPFDYTIINTGIGDIA